MTEVSSNLYLKKFYVLLLYGIMATLGAPNLIQYCKVPQCKICTLGQLNLESDVKSIVSNKSYPLNSNGSCKTDNCVYIISCKRSDCQKKYVGFSTNALNKRLAGHRNHMKNGTEGIAMFNHFCRLHSVEDMQISILEVCPGASQKHLRIREKYWICELNTAYPYGLNDRIDVKGIHDAYSHIHNYSETPIYSIFNKVINNRVVCNKSKATLPINESLKQSVFDAHTFVKHLSELKSLNFIHDCRKKLMDLKIKHIKLLIIHLSEILDQDKNIISIHNEHFVLILRDMCLYRLKKLVTKKNSNHNFMIVKYANSFVDQIPMSKIFKSKDSTSLFPIKNNELCIPSISYEYTKPIRSSIVNYKEPSILSDMSDIYCNCHKYPKKYLDGHHKHIVTGDLNIVSNKHLRGLLQKGLNYREKEKPDKTVTLKAFQSAIDSYCHKLGRSHHLPTTLFSPWKTTIMNNIKSELNKLPNYSYNRVLGNKKVREDLDALKHDFIFCPVDKASSNVSLVCKYYYSKVMIQELENSGNFEEVNEEDNVVIERNINYMKTNKIGPIPNSNHKLPYLYWTTKQHKDPVGSRFITSSTNTTNSTLSVLAGTALKRLLKIDFNESKFKNKFKPYKDHFIIDSRENVINYIKAAK